MEALPFHSSILTRAHKIRTRMLLEEESSIPPAQKESFLALCSQHECAASGFAVSDPTAWECWRDRWTDWHDWD